MQTHRIFAALIAGTLSLGLGCNDPDAKQKEADKAREQARQESDKAAREAEQTRLEQQAKADEKQREANLSLDKARSDYRLKLTDVMSDIDRYVTDLQAKSVTAAPKDKTTNTERVNSIQSKKTVLQHDLDDVDRATATGWDELKSRVDAHVREARTAMLPFAGKT